MSLTPSVVAAAVAALALAVAASVAQAASGEAAFAAETQEFRQLWQECARQLLLDHPDDPEVIRLTPAAGTVSATVA